MVRFPPIGGSPADAEAERTPAFRAGWSCSPRRRQKVDDERPRGVGQDSPTHECTTRPSPRVWPAANIFCASLMSRNDAAHDPEHGGRIHEHLPRRRRSQVCRECRIRSSGSGQMPERSAAGAGVRRVSRSATDTPPRPAPRPPPTSRLRLGGSVWKREVNSTTKNTMGKTNKHPSTGSFGMPAAHDLGRCTSR